MQLDDKAAAAFVKLLGRDPSTVRLRAFPQSDTPKERKQALGARKFSWGDRDSVEGAEAAGLGIYIGINPGGDTKASIKHCIAHFAEFDDLPKDEQLAVVAAKMPPASIIIDTGGDSLHFYWLLKIPTSNKEQWQADQKRIAKYLGSDPSINDPSRVMRLPGAIYFDANQQPAGRAAVLHQGEDRYGREELMSRVPAPAAPPPPTGPPAGPVTSSSTDKAIRQAVEQLSRVPARVPGTGTRHVYLRLLWALAELAGPKEASRMMTQHSPAWAAAEDLAAKAEEGSGAISGSTFFHVVKEEWGITRPSRTTTRTRPSMQPATDQQQPPAVNDKPALEAFRRDIKERIDDGGSDLQILITEKTLQYDITSYQAEAIVRELRKEQDTDSAATASVQQILEERKSLEYRRTELRLEPLLPRCLLNSMRFIMTALPGCDELAAGMIYLGAVSGVLKTGTLIRANYRSFVVPPNMYLAIVGKSGLGKSPTITNIGVRSLDLVRNNYRYINAERFKAWELANNPLPRKDREPKPKPVMMALENYTGEYLAELLQVHEQHQLGLLISCDELSAVFKSLNSYKPGGKGTDEQQLLSLFDGRGSAQGRVDAGIREFDYAQFSILGGMQPRIFDMLAQGGDPFGLYARMHLLPMDDTDQYQDPVETEETIIQYEQHVRQLQSIALKASLLPPAHYRLSDDAMRELAKIQHQARELARAAELDEQSSVYGKRAGQIARLAGIIHILQVAAGEQSHDAQIDLETTCNARDIIVHIQQYALAAHARIHSTGQDDDWLVKSIVKSCKGRQLTAAQYRSQYLTRNKKPAFSTAAIQAVMQRLADARILIVSNESTRSPFFTAA
jgi:hypothetical protein